jgi:acylphosphatase
MSTDSHRRLHVFFSGTVQGVGFRYTVLTAAGSHPVTGWVRNRSDGRVEMLAEGTESALEKFLSDIQSQMSGYIDSIQRTWEAPTSEFGNFKIVPTM